REFREQRNRILIQLSPSYRIQIAEQACRVMIPAPPEITSQTPKPFWGWSDEAIQRTGFVDHGRYLGRRLGEHLNFILAENSRLHSLNDQHTLQNSAVNEWNPQERLVLIFAGFRKVFETWVSVGLLHRHRADLFRHQASQTFMDSHPQLANTLSPETDGGSQHQIGAIRLQQVRGTNVRIKAFGNQGYDVHQRFCGLALLRCKVCDFLEREHVRDTEDAPVRIRALGFGAFLPHV